MRNLTPSPRQARNNEILKISTNTQSGSRDHFMYLSSCLMQTFTGYRDEISTRRKYMMKHNKAEYRSYVSALRNNRLTNGGKTFSSPSWLNCNDNLKPFKFVL